MKTIEIPKILFHPLEPSDPMTTSGKKILGPQFNIMLSYQEGTHSGHDPEDLHKMRVATRRMRVCLRNWRDFFGSKQIKPFEKYLKHLGHQLGYVRDYDTFIIFLKNFKKNLDKDKKKDINQLIIKIQEEREKGLDLIRHTLVNPDYELFLDEFLHFLVSDRLDDISAPLYIEGPNLLNYLLNRILFYRSNIAEASFEQLHRIRIRFKHLRYICEFFSKCYDKRIKEVIKEAVLVQEYLGQIQDRNRDFSLILSKMDTWFDAKEREDLPQGVIDLMNNMESIRDENRLLFLERWTPFVLEENTNRLRYIFQHGIQANLT
jgi:CHAD domain-containing protein